MMTTTSHMFFVAIRKGDGDDDDGEVVNCREIGVGDYGRKKPF